jgi:DNA-binding transcriptional MerR regulator
MENKTNEHFSIQTVSKITGINPHTIRAWEKRYQTVTPLRHENGRRIYLKEHVEKLSLIQSILQHGANISDISGLSISELENYLGQFASKIPQASFAQADDEQVSYEEIDLNNIHQNLLLALKTYRLDIINYELEKIKGSLDLREFSLNFLSPLLQDVGHMISTGQFNISQEHGLSSILRFYIGSLLYRRDKNTPLSKNIKTKDLILITSPEKEMHEFGILISALLCKHYDLNFLYLGPNLPLDALVETAKQLGAKHIILGISQSSQYLNQTDLTKYIVDLWERTQNTEIIVGGIVTPNQELKNLNKIDFIPTLNLLDSKLSNLK